MENQLNIEIFNNLIDVRKNKLYHYSKYWSYVDIAKNDVFQYIILPELHTCFQLNHKAIIQVEEKNQVFLFIVEKQEWESNYFKNNIFKINYVLYDNASLLDISKAITKVLSILKSKGCEYCYLEIPSEDNLLIQAFCQSTFRLVESRLTYFHNNLQQFNIEKRNKVRLTNMSDILTIKNVSMTMRNEFDRVHSDVFFGKKIADEYLGKFAEECIKGFADYVIVPDEPNIPVEAFFATNYNAHDWEKLNIKVGQFALAAVQSSTCKGWYGKLLTETCLHLKEKGIKGVITNTQSTNKAVIHNYEKFGFKYGHSSLILSKTLK